MITADKNQPMVSVLVATYNQEEFIARTLDSLLMQQCSFDFEILIGEDCSSDRTRQICMEYQEKYPEKIVLCLNERNKGLLDNYFDIFLKSRGKYIADCGGDDYWQTTDKLQKQVDLLERDERITLVAGRWSIYHQKSGLLTEAPDQRPEDWYRPEVYGKKAVISYLNESVIPRVVLSTSCFRRDVAMEAYLEKPELFRSKEVTCEDLPLTLCLLKKGPFYFSKDIWLVYRVLENSLSHSESENEYVSGFAFNTFKQTVLLARALDVKPTEIPEYIDKWVGNFVLHAFIARDYELMKAMLQFSEIGEFPFRTKQVLLKFCMSVPVVYDFSRWMYLQFRRLVSKGL